MSEKNEGLKQVTVYTFYYPEDDMFLAYTSYQGSGSKYQKNYVVDAKNGTDAKKIALRMRKEEERAKR